MLHSDDIMLPVGCSPYFSLSLSRIHDYETSNSILFTIYISFLSITTTTTTTSCAQWQSTTILLFRRTTTAAGNANAPTSNTNTTSTPRTTAPPSGGGGTTNNNNNNTPTVQPLPLSRLNTPTPSLDGSGHSSSDSKMSGSSSTTARKPLLNRGSSALGLDKMIDEKRDAKTMSERVVHIEVRIYANNSIFYS